MWELVIESLELGEKAYRRFAIGKLPMSLPDMVIPGVGKVVLGVVVPAVFDDRAAAMEVEIMLIEGTVMLYVGSI